MEEAAQECDFDLEFDWAGESARLVGTVVHRILEQLGSQDMAQATELERFSAIGRRMLMQEGLPAEQLDAAAGRIDDALAGILQDQRGCWILSTEHKDAQCEYALTWRVGDQVRHMIIDRTFIDANDDRWIIDYKTGSHTGGGMDEFLDREQERYRQQLDDYAAAFSRLEGRPIRLGLYFPLLNGWREWRYKE
jgi:ATP-dependent exoDNAse (exonuclease V) beta subunit